MNKKLILDQQAIEQIIRRIAHEIYENNIDAKTICLVGIDKQGQELANLISKELSEIDAAATVKSFLIKLDKKNPKDTVELQAESGDLDNAVVVLIDDVLNTGKTIAYSIIPLMDEHVSKIEIAVLVDRGHRTYPVSASYSGIQLATTLEEHIEVKLGKKPTVHLF
jgi:pyrimidine operon attenuation protein/uracil phosphoribosyltransferase